MSTVSDADSTAVPYEIIERRYNVVVKLESWELMAMNSIASNESIPRVRLRMLKSLAGVSRDEASGYGGGSGEAVASSSSAAAGGGGAGRRRVWEGLTVEY